MLVTLSKRLMLTSTLGDVCECDWPGVYDCMGVDGAAGEVPAGAEHAASHAGFYGGTVASTHTDGYRAADTGSYYAAGSCTAAPPQ